MGIKLKQYEKKEQCCGCSACEQICPTNAIKLVADEEGFLFPVTDEKKCIHCNACKRVCAFQNGRLGHDSAKQDYYAARTKDTAVLKQSSSGGVFTVLSDYILNQGGYVYGAAYGEDFHVEHQCADDSQKRDAFRGSKYVQSDLKNTYSEIAEQLKQKKKVMFSGTPCQNAGLLSFLEQKRIDTSLLYTCDHICHGVPSPRVFRDYLYYLKTQAGEKISQVNMRDKRYGWRAKKASVTFPSEEKPVLSERFPYIRMYSSLNPVRKSCFSCPYTQYDRQSDITLADFWNVKAKSNMNDDQGVSMVLVNSPKGKEWMGCIEHLLLIESCQKQDCWQPHLEYPPVEPAGRERFFQIVQNDAECSYIEKYTKGTLLSNLIKKLTPIIKKLGLYKVAGKIYQVVFGKRNGV